MVGIIRVPRSSARLLTRGRLLLAWLVLTAAFLALVATAPFGAWGTVAVVDYVSALAPLLAGIGCLRAARSAEGSWRSGWRLLGLSVLSWSAGGVVWAFYEVHLGVEVPYPSLADVGYLLAVPLAAAAMARMAGRRHGGVARARLLLDGSIAACAIFAVSWALVLGPTVAASEGSWLARGIGLAYPVGDVVVATIALLALARAGGRTRAALTLIGLAQLMIAASDSLFLWLTAQGAYITGTLIDAGWFAGFLLIGVASLEPTVREEDDPESTSTLLELLLPSLPLMLGLPPALGWVISGRPLDPVLFYAGVLLIVLVLARQMLALLVNRRLSHQLTATVAQLREHEQELRHQVLHDALTGLANRTLFADRLAHFLERPGRRPLGLLLADLDDFKLVNDTLGHLAGDALLVAVAERLRACAGPGDTVARLGGDEFAILLEDCADAEPIEVAQRIARALKHPFSLVGTDMIVRASVGIAIHDGRGDGEAMLREADLAMYEAKRQGKGRFALFEPAMAAASLQRLRLKTDLAVAPERDELFVLYQPMVDVRTGEVTGFEALVRWQHAELGVVGPDQFIPLAEESGAILPIGRWVMATACRQLARWRGLQPPGASALRMSVNVSGRQLSDPELLPAVARALADNNLPAELLTLELTESTLLADREQAIEQLSRLRGLGLRIAIDDFGTGYSDMSRLQHYPITTLKVDKTFVQGLHRGERHATLLLSSVEQLGRGLNLHLVAEGVETEEQLAVLRELGYPEAQGYLFSRPVRPELIDDLVRSGIPLGAALRP